MNDRRAYLKMARAGKMPTIITHKAQNDSEHEVTLRLRPRWFMPWEKRSVVLRKGETASVDTDKKGRITKVVIAARRPV